MSSRLDRLFLLLETGSTLVTRKAAALQLGEVQRLHPHELHNLLAKVHTYLHSSSWDTRIAASIAVEAIVKNVELWFPIGINHTSLASTENDVKYNHTVGRMNFDKYDLNSVIKCGHNLLASEGKEFDDTPDPNNCAFVDQKEKIAKQRLLLNHRLGLDVANHLGLQIDSNEFVTNSDLASDDCCESEALDLSNKSTDLDDMVSKVTGKSVKRKANRLNRIKSIDNSIDGKKIKIESEDIESNANEEQTFDILSSNEWPLESFSDELMCDLFNPLWEVRHGAATALREIIKLQGKCGGRTRDTPSHLMDAINQLWLEDFSLRLISVLALDKFGDFVSDQVVAPVRETCAQTLGLVLNLLSAEGVHNVLKILLELLSCNEWEARHGGMLGLKYLLAIRQDLAFQLLPLVYQPIFNGLKDSVDDVSAVAAAALVPVKHVLMETLPEKVPIVIAYLWDALLELDDLSSSTGDLLMLLSSLLTFNSDFDCSQLTILVPRLWPFLSHSLSSVRKSVLEALLILSSKDAISWLNSQLLSDALRLLYQRCLIEYKEEILNNLYQVWHRFVTKSSYDNLLLASCQHLSGWVCLMMHPSKIPIDIDSSPTWLNIKQFHNHSEQPLNNKYRNNKFGHQNSGDSDYFIGGNETLSENQEEREKYVIRARHQCAKFIGLLSYFIAKENSSCTITTECLANILLFHLNSKSATQRMCIAWVIKEWAKVTITLNDMNDDFKIQLIQSISNKCLECLQEYIYYDEISSLFTRLQLETREFVSLLRQNNVTFDENVYKSGVVYSFDQITTLANTLLKSSGKNSKNNLKETSIEYKCKNLLKSSSDLSRYQASLSTCVLSAIAGALISWNDIPEKLNPIVRPLMDSLKSEENEHIQSESALSLVRLLKICCDRPINSSTISPVPKIIKNLITYLCSDLNFTPVLNITSDKLDDVKLNNNNLGILTLDNMQKFSDKAFLRRSSSVNSQKKGKFEASTSVDETALSNFVEPTVKQNETLRRGATLAIIEIAKYFGCDLPNILPSLWEQITNIMNDSDAQNKIEPKDLICCLQVLEVIGPHMHKSLYSYLITLLNHLSIYLQSEYMEIRHMSARCFGMLSVVIKKETMTVVLKQILDLLEAADSVIKRQGAVEAISCIIDSLALDIVPYIVLLIVPMLGRMSDQNDKVRLMATHCFAQLVQLMPLDNSTNIDTNVEYTKEMLEKREIERHFLEQLMNIKQLDDYILPIPVKAELRTYQTEGVNWLAFLNKYKLHGIVADEMGLGKTLQAICILASDHFYQSSKLKNCSKGSDLNLLPSLVICPPTLTGHWLYEVDKFVNVKYLNPLHYTGPPNDRMKLRNKIKLNSNKQSYNIVIASYDIVRNDIEFFSSIKWNYCILDEGHVIKNGKTKLAKAIKSLPANHRLILTGTPIQNNVLELWSLFDFLMPGFLGTERQFLARYSRPILQSRDAKSSSKEQEAGVLAMESLHRQVLPFILRRMKEDVLKDLPPKIMQDYYCELSALQAQLYEDFAKSRARQNMQESIGESNVDKNKTANAMPTTHIFQALQYLRKVCNHPKLVVSSQHPQYDAITAQLKQQKSSLSDISHAAKLCALKQLLLDCGIGTQSLSQVINGSEPVVNQHRALVFCQLKSMLDIVENDLFKVHMPTVSYLRLDGNVPPISRHSVVHRFNNDPSIDVLLLTTQVGGLGLNLTGADTVIFVEHDWNPMKDLQAMDRAHRIGQRKVVNVYRLITTGTLEEKIMGLQKFKLTIANTVISSENSSLKTMATDQILDLFNLDKNIKAEKSNKVSGGDSDSSSSMKNVLDTLPDLWESDQYEKEYDLTHFIQSLK